MAKDTIRDWATTASDNQDIAGISILGTAPPSNMDNALRTIMKQVADVAEGVQPVDDTWSFSDPADPTKKARIDAGNVTAGQTRVLKMADRDVNLAALADGTLSGARNKIMNGDFDVWQRGTSVSFVGGGSGSFIADRWRHGGNTTGTDFTSSRQTHTLGQTDVPGQPKYFYRFNRTTTGANVINLSQRIEGVRTLEGKSVTITFYAKGTNAKQIDLTYDQVFGTGGSPSGTVSATIQSGIALTTAWQKFQYTFSLPSISGKTLGTAGNDYLSINFGLPSAQGNMTLDLSHVSLVVGNATDEADPFPAQSVADVLTQCQRFYNKTLDQGVFPAASGATTETGSVEAYCAVAGSSANVRSGSGAKHAFPVTMRAAPTVTVYSVATGATGNARNLVTATDVAFETISVGDTGVFSRPTGAVTLGDRFMFYLTADAEL